MIQLTSTVSGLSLEKGLRFHSDKNQKGACNGRVAFSAQMVAMTKEHTQMESHLSNAKDFIEVNRRRQL